MDFRKLMLGIFVAMLGASFMHQASAQWGTGGGVIGGRKSLSDNFDLFCDLDRTSFGGVILGQHSNTGPHGQLVKIVTAPSAAFPSDPTSFEFSGRMFCAEVPLGTVNPSLEDGVVIEGIKLVALFELQQMPPKISPRPGLQYSESTSGGKTTRTWKFVVPATPEFPFPELLYELVPVVTGTSLDAAIPKVCEFGTTNCRALFGLQIPAAQGDYPPRDLDGDTINDLALGEVFKFSTVTTGGNEFPNGFSWGVCNSHAYINPQDRSVEAIAHSSTIGNTDIPGANPPFTSVLGSGLDTGINWPSGVPLAFTTNQNDLWNSGVVVTEGVPGTVSNCDPFCRWSNADGQSQTLIATGNDDSGLPALTTIGTNAADHTQNGLTLPVGRLVGKFGSGPFFDIGVAQNIASPAGGVLKLFYWDSNNLDNQEQISVRVANRAIECLAGDPTSNTRGSTFSYSNEPALALLVDFSPTLGVNNTDPTAVLPTTISGSNTLTIGSDGSPIFDPNSPTKAWVNGHPVRIASFEVGNLNKGNQRDLRIFFNRLDVIDALTPGNKCPGFGNRQDVEATLVIGNQAFGNRTGTDTVTLTSCQSL